MHRIYCGLIALVVGVGLVVGADEELIPDGENNPATWRLDNGGTTCDSADCHLEVDEDPDDYPGSPETACAGSTACEINPNTNNAVIALSFGTPAANVSEGTDDQAFHIIMSRCVVGGAATSGGTDPNYDIDIYCGGVLDSTIAADVDVTSMDLSTVHSWTFSTTGPASCAADGNSVNARVTVHQAGGGGNRRIACIQAIEWEVVHEAVGGDELMIIPVN